MRIFYKVLSIVLSLALLAGCGSQSVSGVSDPLVSDTPAPVIDGPMTIVFPKIGSADAAVIMNKDATVLIDTGESGDADEILDVLNQYGRNSIDLLLISHYDKDHVGGAAEIIETVTVKRVIGSTSPKDSDEMQAYLDALEAAGLAEETPSGNVTITLDGMVFSVDAPKKSSYTQDQSNNSSTIVTLTYGDTVLLFGGDAMTLRLQEYNWTEHAYDLIKIPHHGRDAEDTAYYLSSVKSGGSAIITSSKKEPENEELISILEDAGITPYLTRNGVITVISDGKSLSITQET